MIEYIPGDQNIVAKGIKETKIPGVVYEEDESSGEEDLDVYDVTERYEVCERYHNSIVGHLGNV